MLEESLLYIVFLLRFKTTIQKKVILHGEVNEKSYEEKVWEVNCNNSCRLASITWGIEFITI